jgi:hypothetical protein
MDLDKQSNEIIQKALKEVVFWMRLSGVLTIALIVCKIVQSF